MVKRVGFFKFGFYENTGMSRIGKNFDVFNINELYLGRKKPRGVIHD